MCRVLENPDLSSPDCKLFAQEGWAIAIMPVKMPATVMLNNVEKLLGLIMHPPLGMKPKIIRGRVDLRWPLNAVTAEFYQKMTTKGKRPWAGNVVIDNLI